MKKKLLLSALIILIATFSFSQTGTTVSVIDLKPLDKILFISGDTGVVLSQKMMKEVRLLIQREVTYNEHLDSLRNTIKSERSIMLTYSQIVESMKRESAIWEDMNEITTKQLLEEKRKVKLWKGITTLAGIIIFAETILFAVSSIK